MFFARKLSTLAVFIASLLSPFALGGLAAFGLSLIPSENAHACLPCDCPTNFSLNCFGPYAINTIGDSAETCYIQVLKVDGEAQGEFAFEVDAKTLQSLPERPEENTLIESYYEIQLYKLTSGEYQINAGPYFENKVYVLNFRNCPAEQVRESNFTAEPVVE